MVVDNDFAEFPKRFEGILFDFGIRGLHKSSMIGNKLYNFSIGEWYIADLALGNEVDGA